MSNLIKEMSNKNVVFVSATGNNSTDANSYAYLCSIDNVICVGSIDNIGVYGAIDNYY